MYEKNPKTVNELKDYILNAFKEIDEDQNLCRTVCHSVLDRCEECCNSWRRTFWALKRLNSFWVSVHPTLNNCILTFGQPCTIKCSLTANSNKSVLWLIAKIYTTCFYWTPQQCDLSLLDFCCSRLKNKCTFWWSMLQWWFFGNKIALVWLGQLCLQSAYTTKVFITTHSWQIQF